MVREMKKSQRALQMLIHDWCVIQFRTKNEVLFFEQGLLSGQPPVMSLFQTEQKSGLCVLYGVSSCV